MKVARRQGLLASVVVASGWLTGCGAEGEAGPAELFVDSVLSAITASGTPDLWVSSVSGPASAQSGDSFFVTVTACNQGAGSASATVNLHLSSDTSITAMDAQVGSVATGPLHPNQCATLHVPTTGTSVSNGLWYVGAVIDPGNAVGESSETNNTRAGTRMAFGSGPDLSLSEVSAPASLHPYDSFEAVATVCNTGNDTASANVEVFLSTDSAISVADTLVGTGSTNTLSPGQCTPLRIPASLSGVSDGTYFVGAVVDRSNSVMELTESNNTRAGNRVVVGSGPDFTVSAVSGPASFNGGVFTATATVCNQGTSGSSTEVEVYLTADSTLNTADLLLGSVPVNYLEAGQCAPVTLTAAPAGVSNGSYYVAAWVDRSNSQFELVETNNTRLGGRLVAGSGPDLVVTAVGAAPSVTYQESLSVTATVCNQGTGFSSSTQLDFHLSLDAAISSLDPQLSTASVPELGAGECAPVTALGPVNVTDGTWYVGAWVDRSNSVSELAENNNTKVGAQTGVGSVSDLVISAITAPVSLKPGDFLETQVTVCNQGTQSTSGSPQVALYLSSDTFITASDFFVSHSNLPSLDAGQCRTLSLHGGGWAPQGTWYLGAIADLENAELELIENNNTRLGGTLTIGMGVDYVVTGLRVPSILQPGQPFKAVATVCNQGTETGYGPGVTFHFSADANVTFRDMFFGSRWGNSSLAPGECGSVTYESSASFPDGTWYLGAIADGFDDEFELNEDNNAGGVTQVRVGHGPDLVLEELSHPASSQPGQGFAATAVVCNRGTSYSDMSSLALHYSRDGVISEADLFAGSAEVPWLEPGDCASATVPNLPSPPNGLWTLGVRLDRNHVIPELREDNNAAAGGTLAVGHGPDLYVSRVRGPTIVDRHAPFTFTATVCNQGTDAADYSYVELYLSEDARITPQDFFSGGNGLGRLEPGQCRDVSVQSSTSADYGEWYLGVVADAHQSWSELREDNNVHLVEDFIVGYGRDLSITRLDAPANVAPGAMFPVSLTVCNEGTQYSYHSYVELFLSDDEHVGEDEWHIGGYGVDTMEPGQCRILHVQAYAGPSGMWTLGARLDPYGDPDLRESNNTRLAGPVFFANGPDMAITAITATRGGQYPEDLEATATVCNQGTEPGYAYVQLLLSADRHITYSDYFVSGRPVDQLEPGKCRAVRIPVQGGMHGAWTLGGILDPSGYDLRAENDRFAGDRVAIGHGPDVSIKAIQVPSTLPMYGQFTSDITVCNEGSQFTNDTSVDLFFSTDAHIDQNDLHAGFAPLPSLPPGECVTVRAQGQVNVNSDGPVYLGASVWTWSDELRKDNDTHAVEVLVGYGWDLAVTQVTVPPILGSGMPFTAQAVVCNQGMEHSDWRGVELFLSDPNLIPSYQYMGGYEQVPGLAPGECTTVSLEGYAYPNGPDGKYLVGAQIDQGCCGGGSELRTDNNRLTTPVIIGHGSDLAVTDLQVPASAQPGQPIDFTVTVCNPGSAPFSGGEVELYASEDETHDPQDFLLGATGAPSLGSGQCANVNMQGFTSAPEGVWKLVAFAHSAYDELTLENNTLVRGTLAVGLRADLVVTHVSGPTVVESYANFPVSATVCNQGTQGSLPTEVNFVLTYDERVTQGDYMVGMEMVPALAAGECAPVSGLAYAPSYSQAPYRLAAMVDSQQYEPELNEENNGRVGSWLGIGSGVELVVTHVTGPAAVTPGQSFDAQVTLCNLGTYTTYNNDVAVVLSQDATVTSADRRVGFGNWYSLNPGECFTFDVPVYADVSEGTWTLGAIVDPNNYVYELIEQNNATAGSSLGVGFKPEVTIASVQAPTSVPSGSGFVTDVEVCNAGTESYPGDLDVAVVFSTDGTFTLDDVVAGSAPVGLMTPGQCTWVSVPGTAYPGPGPYQLGVIVDSANVVSEFNEANNTASGGTVDVQ